MKQYRKITRLEALQMLVDNEAKPIRGLAFKSSVTGSVWRTADLYSVNCNQNSTMMFSTYNATYPICAIVTEVDPFEEWFDPKKFMGCKSSFRKAYELGQKNPLDTTKKPDESGGS